MEAFRYDEEQEQWGTIFDTVEGMPMEQDLFDDLDRVDQIMYDEVKTAMLTYFNRPVPSKQPLVYEAVENFIYSIMHLAPGFQGRVLQKANSQSTER